MEFHLEVQKGGSSQFAVFYHKNSFIPISLFLNKWKSFSFSSKQEKQFHFYPKVHILINNSWLVEKKEIRHTKSKNWLTSMRLGSSKIIWGLGSVWLSTPLVEKLSLLVKIGSTSCTPKTHEWIWKSSKWKRTISDFFLSPRLMFCTLMIQIDRISQVLEWVP